MEEVLHEDHSGEASSRARPEWSGRSRTNREVRRAWYTCLGCTRHRQDYVAAIARRFDPDRPAVAGLPWLMNESSDAVNDDSSIRPSLSHGLCNEPPDKKEIP